MTIENRSLVVDLVEWVAREPRTYEEVMDAWRTSCPRLTVWEDAISQGYLAREREPSGKRLVIVTEAGQNLLRFELRTPG